MEWAWLLHKLISLPSITRMDSTLSTITHTVLILIMKVMIYWIFSFSIYRRWLSHGRCSKRGCESWRSPSTRQLDCRKYTRDPSAHLSWLSSIMPDLWRQPFVLEQVIAIFETDIISNRHLDWRRYSRCIHWERGTTLPFLWLAGSSRQRRRHVSSSHEYKMICSPGLQRPFRNLQRNRRSPSREEQAYHYPFKDDHRIRIKATGNTWCPWFTYVSNLQANVTNISDSVIIPSSQAWWYSSLED